jgi:dolichol-phosphate mannosyltransferase
VTDLVSLYQRRFGDSIGVRNRIWKILCQSFFQSLIPDTGDETVVDVGCGYGEFLNNIRAKNRIGVDRNPDSAHFLDEEVTSHIVDARELPRIVPSADVVFSSNFLEHLPSKEQVTEVLEACRKCLEQREGLLILMGPNIRFLPGTYWDFYDHHVPLSDRSLVEILELLGFHIQAVYPRFLPYTMSRGGRAPTWAVWLYLRLKVLWPLLGRQFLIVASTSVQTEGEHV